VLFIALVSRAGWAWFVDVCNHVGAVLLLLSVVGVSIFSVVRLSHWWIALVATLGLGLVLFVEGAYRVCRAAEEARLPTEITPAVVPSGDRTGLIQMGVNLRGRVDVENRDPRTRALAALGAYPFGSSPLEREVRDWLGRAQALLLQKNSDGADSSLVQHYRMPHAALGAIDHTLGALGSLRSRGGKTRNRSPRVIDVSYGEDLDDEEEPRASA
jgi:hypothetical protein